MFIAEDVMINLSDKWIKGSPFKFHLHKIKEIY